MVEDQDLLYGPQEMQSAALIEANLKTTESELAHAQTALAHEREQREVMEAALNAKVADAEVVRDSSQAENSDLKERLAGKLIFCCYTAFPLVLLFFLF